MARALRFCLAGAFTFFLAVPMNVHAAYDVSNIQPVSRKQVVDFFGTANVKTVFVVRRARQLAYVDWSETTADEDVPTVRLISMPSVSSPQKPMLSPDGNYLTFVDGGSTGDRSSKSRTGYVCKLEENPTLHMIVPDSCHIPRWVQNPDITPTIVFSSCGSGDGGSRVYNSCGATYKVSVNAGVPGTPQVIYSGGGFLSGLSPDQKWLAAAENSPHLYMTDITSSEDIVFKTPLITRPSECDTASIQVCNGSVTSSRVTTDVALCLDFSGNHPEMGGEWGIHDRIQVFNSKSEIVDYYDVSDETIEAAGDDISEGQIVDNQWEGSEWSNHPYYLVANLGLTRAGGSMARERVYAINLYEKKDTELVRTTDTTNIPTPHLWAEIPNGFVEAAGWLENPVYTAETVVDTCKDPEPVPNPKEDEDEDEGGLCGKGAGVALLPPFGLKLGRVIRRRKRKGMKQ